MRKTIVNVLSGITVGAAMLGGCGEPAIQPSGEIKLSLSAGAGSEDVIASKPRIGMLYAPLSTFTGRAEVAQVHELTAPISR